MPHQRLIFVTFALSLCILLGIVSIVSNPRSKLHRLFFFFNLSLGFYNFADYMFYLKPPSLALMMFRLSSAGGAMMVYYFLAFIYELVGFSRTPLGKKNISRFRILSIFFTFLFLTPFLIKDISVNSSVPVPIMGSLFPLFIFYSIVGLLVAVFPLLSEYKIGTKHQKTQILYVFTACLCGIAAISAYFVSFIWKDLPWIYYPLQSVVSFIFAYLIFQYSLIPVSVALRRVLLVVAIYLVLAMILIPLTLFSRQNLVQEGAGALVTWVVMAGIVFSLGPIVYAHTVRHVSLFQDKTASHIAHELKTPLHAIQSAKTILQEEWAQAQPDRNKIHDYLDMIQRNSQRLEGFVREILNLSKAGSPGTTAAKTSINLLDLAHEIVDSFPDHSSRISIQSDGTSTLLAIEEGVRQIMINLVSNAVRAAAEGKILIHIDGTADHRVQVSIQDHGHGLAKEDLSRIFDPFVQVTGAKEKNAKGTGLGLAIAQKWVHAHQGKIWAESEGIGHGSRFIFILPRE